MEKFREYSKVSALSRFLEWHTEGEVRVLQWCQSYCSCLHVVITLKIMVIKMIFQTWRDGSLSMADRGCTLVFQNFTRERCRVVEWHWHCAVERCNAEAEQLS
jgi:hypothetical protein